MHRVILRSYLVLVLDVVVVCDQIFGALIMGILLLLFLDYLIDE